MPRRWPALVVCYLAASVGVTLGGGLFHETPVAGAIAIAAGVVAAPVMRDVAANRTGVRLSDAWVAFVYPFLLTMAFVYLLILLPILRGT